MLCSVMSLFLHCRELSHDNLAPGDILGPPGFFISWATLITYIIKELCFVKPSALNNKRLLNWSELS